MVNRPFPKNFNALTLTCVNEFSWHFLSPRTRSYDSVTATSECIKAACFVMILNTLDRMKRNEENNDDTQK